MPILTSPVRTSERQELLDLAVQTGLFASDEAESLLGCTLDSIADGSLSDKHMAIACRDTSDGPVVGWSYFAPDQYADGVWNVWWIGVAPSHHGTGVAQALLTQVEATIASFHGRVVVIETSDQAPMARARKFYSNAGYSECGRIPNFYGTGDAKVILSRSLVGY